MKIRNLRIAIFTTLMILTEIINAEDCPQNTPEWVAWHQAKISLLKSDRNFLALKPIASTLQRCKIPKVYRECLSPLRKFSSKVFDVHKPGRSLGLSLSDQDYIDYLKKNKLGTLPEDFLTSDFLSQFELDTLDDLDFQSIVGNIKVLGKKNGFNQVFAFPYSSKFIPSVDPAKTFGRFFILLENDTQVIISQINIFTETGKAPSSISVIHIDKNRGKAYFHDLYRVRDKKKIKVVSRLQANRRLEDCTSCHKSAFIPIKPAKSFNYELHGDDLSEANLIMRRYRSIKQAFKPSASDEPSLGVLDASRCSKVSSEDRLSLQCQDCHNHKNGNALTFPSGLDIQLPKRTSLVKEWMLHTRDMPPWFHEKPIDFAQNIFQCIIDDFYGNEVQKGRLFEYLENKSCISQLKLE